MAQHSLLERGSWIAGILGAALAAWALISPGQPSNTTTNANTSVTGSGNTVVQNANIIVQSPTSKTIAPVFQIEAQVSKSEAPVEKSKKRNAQVSNDISKPKHAAPTNTIGGNKDPLLNTLNKLGLGQATSAVYDFVKNLDGKAVTQGEVAQEIQNRINMYGVTMRAESVINALAQDGFLAIEQSNLHANESLTFGSQRGGAVVGNNSTLTTNRTAITAGPGAFIETQGNAQVRQNPDGSISFLVGGDGNVNFKVSK